jgi:hypothetical protein
MEKLIPADTVDAYGNVWETTGENIRHGVKDFSERDAKMIVNALFPVGSIYLGENSFITSVGTWEMLSDGIAKPYLLMTSLTTGERQQSNMQEVTEAGTPVIGVVLRAWKRVS